MDDYYMIEAGPESEAGSNGGLMLKTPNSLQSVTNSVVVENIGESMKVIEKAGGRLLEIKLQSRAMDGSRILWILMIMY